MTTNESSTSLPDDLADKLRTARASRRLQGQRRVVTILFCDVVGSTAMAAQLDPEEWAEVMNESFEYMITPVYRYEGTVARLMGDAILAFFGAPIAHEDDPQRAVLAGLDILAGMGQFRQSLRQQYGMDFDVRVGINTGEVVMGEVGTDFALEYTAMGDAVNLAARMQQTAHTGTVQITSETYRLVAPFFETESLGKIEIKGREQPIPAYRVIRPREATGGLPGMEGFEAPLTGRKRELVKLLQALEDVWAGDGRIVFLVGEAGLGKSRLIREVHQAWERRARYKDSWISIRGVSYERDQPYGVVGHYLRHRFGITPGDSTEVMVTKFSDNLAADPLVEDFEALVVAFTGLMEPSARSGASGLASIAGEALKTQLFSSSLEIFKHSLSMTPMAFVVDDTQWADPASVELIQHLFQVAVNHPVLFLCATRPHRESPGWQLREAAERLYAGWFREVGLLPLETRESDELVVRLLEESDLPDGLREMIRNKADGNPFFIEEITRNLIENGSLVRAAPGKPWEVASELADISIPETLIALLTGRMDRLTAGGREILQIAAVIGRIFRFDLLAEVAQRPLEELDEHVEEFHQAGLVVLYPEAQQLTYAFRHDLTRDAVYHSLLHRQRRALHGQVAAAIERQSGDHLPEEVSTLAFHFDQAGQLDRAHAYHKRAGDEAARLFAHREAITHYQRALALLQKLDAPAEQLTSLYLRLGRVLELASRFSEALEVYGVMELAAAARGDQEMALKALIHRSQVHSTPNVEFDFELGESLAHQALALAKKLADEEAQARVHWILNNLYRLSNRWADGRAAGEKAVALARKLGHKSLLASALNDLSHVYMSSVDPVQAHQLLDEARELWEEMGNQPMLADTLGTMSLADYIRGDFDSALQHSSEAYQISLAAKNPWGQSYSLLMIGDVYWERGEVDRAIKSLEESVGLGEKAGFLVPQVENRAFLGLIYGYLGNKERGLALALQAREVARQSDAAYLRPSRGYLAELYVVHGELEQAEQTLGPLDELVLIDPVTSTFSYSAWCRLLLARGENQAASELADKLLALLRPLGFRLFLPKILYHRGQALHALGQIEAARASLDEALQEAHAIGSQAIKWLILGAQADIAADEGNGQQEEKLRQQAREIIDFIAAHIRDEGLRQSYLNMDNVRAVRG